MPYGPRSLFSLSRHIRTNSTNLPGMELKYIPLFYIEPYRVDLICEATTLYSVSLLFELSRRDIRSEPYIYITHPLLLLIELSLPSHRAPNQPFITNLYISNNVSFTTETYWQGNCLLGSAGGGGTLNLPRNTSYTTSRPDPRLSANRFYAKSDSGTEGAAQSGTIEYHWSIRSADG